MSFAKQQVLSIAGVSPLTLRDEVLFRVAFPKTTTFYAHSWLYLLRASHLDDGSLGYKFFSPELAAIIGYRNGFVYVTPVIDTTGGVRLRKLCDDLIKTTNCNIVLKKLTSHLLPPNNVAIDSAPLEDDSEPETVLLLDKLFIDQKETINPSANRVIRKLRAFELHSHNLAITTDMRTIPLEAIEQFLLRWPQKHAHYMPMVRYLHEQKTLSPRYRSMIFTENGTVRAIYLAEQLSINEIGLYCGVTARDKPGLTEWMDIQFFKMLFREGIGSVYLGGSEREGVAHFITKLLPYKPPYAVHAMLYNPKKTRPLWMTVQLATEYDIAPVAEVYRNTYNSLYSLGESWTKETAHRFISHFYRRQPDLFFVAKVNGKVVGAAFAAIQPWWDGNHLVEGELFVDPSQTNKAIEKTLFKRLLTTARHKYYVVAWDTLMPTVDAHPFSTYKTIGFNDMPHVRAMSGDIVKVLARLGE